MDYNKTENNDDLRYHHSHHHHHKSHMTFPDFTRHFLALLTEPIDTFCLAVLVR